MRRNGEGQSEHAPSPPTITWRPVDALDLFEARIIDEGGRALYVGYVGHTPRDGDDEWRGYVGVTHVLVSIGRREAVQAAVERAAREAWAAQQTWGRVTPRGSDT